MGATVVSNAYSDLCQDWGLDESLAELVASRGSEPGRESHRKAETSHRVRVFLVEHHGTGTAAFDSEATEGSSQMVRIMADRTLIVGNFYQIEQEREGEERLRRLTRCVWCRLKDQERFEAELRYVENG